MLHPSATTKLKVAPQYVPSFYNARAKRSDGQSPPLPVSGGGRQLDISFRPLLSEALHFSTAAPNVTGHEWLYPTGYPVYAPARSPVEGI